MTTFTNFNGTVTTYTYDDANRLVGLSMSAGGSALAGYAFTRGGNVTQYYICRAGLIALQPQGGSVYCYHFDATGNTVALTDQSGSIANTYAYKPYGEMTAGLTQTVTQPFTYVGQYGVIAESYGYYYMRARYYDSGSGRFVSEDPLGFGGGDVNLYAYVRGNPVNGIDPDGCQAVITPAGPMPLPPASSGSLTANQINRMQEDLSSLAKLFNPQPLLSLIGDKISSVLCFANESKKSGKEKANDIPSWARGQKPAPGESGKDFADRLLTDKYGEGNYKVGSGTEHNQIKKYAIEGERRTRRGR